MIPYRRKIPKQKWCSDELLTVTFNTGKISWTHLSLQMA